MLVSYRLESKRIICSDNRPPEECDVAYQKTRQVDCRNEFQLSDYREKSSERSHQHWVTREKSPSRCNLMWISQHSNVGIVGAIPTREEVDKGDANIPTMCTGTHRHGLFCNHGNSKNEKPRRQSNSSKEFHTETSGGRLLCQDL